MKEPTAMFFTEGEGMFTLRCKTVKQAQKEMQREIDLSTETDLEMLGFGKDLVIKLEDVQEQIMYEHRKCGIYTIDEPICMECGEELYRNRGRKTFVVYL